MIDLQALTNAINENLGTDLFIAYLHTNNAADEREKRTIVTVKATRVPFGLTTKELDAESLSLTLTFDLPADKISTRDRALERIKEELLGWRSFDVKQPGEEEGEEIVYEVTTFFEQQSPDNPYLDNGGQTQQIVVSGTALVKNVTSGALVGNSVKVYLDKQPLVKTARTAAGQFGFDTRIPLSTGSITPEIDAISKTNTITISGIYTGQDIEKTIIRIADGVFDCPDNPDDSIDPNETYAYNVVYNSDLSFTSNVKITSAVVRDQIGAFLQYEVTLQVVEK
jgi:hypothetical protein